MQKISVSVNKCKEEEKSYKNCPAVSCSPTRKYSKIANMTRVMRVTGTSTSVRAIESAKGWYIAALKCLRTIGRCAKRDGISDIDVNAEKRIALCAKRHQLIARGVMN